jgi:hypothetical protein
MSSSWAEAVPAKNSAKAAITGHVLATDKGDILNRMMDKFLLGEIRTLRDTQGGANPVVQGMTSAPSRKSDWETQTTLLSGHQFAHFDTHFNHCGVISQ